MDALYFEDYTPSLNFTTRSRTIREADLVNFLGVSGMFESLFADASTRKRDRGIVVTDHAVLNQRDEPVMTLRVTRMIKRRPD